MTIILIQAIGTILLFLLSWNLYMKQRKLERIYLRHLEDLKQQAERRSPTLLRRRR